MSFTLRIFFEILTGFNFQSMSIFLVDLLWLDMSGATISVRSQNGSELEGVVWSSLSLSLSLRSRRQMIPIRPILGSTLLWVVPRPRHPCYGHWFGKKQSTR